MTKKHKLSAKLIFAFILTAGILLFFASVFLINCKQWQKVIQRRLHDRYTTDLERQVRSYRIRQNGNYWILHNYIAAHSYSYSIEHNNITLVTHGTYQDLYLLEGLVRVWQAPISITLFTNGRDFDVTLNSIRYLLKCSVDRILIQKYVSFHFCFHNAHFPRDLPKRTVYLQLNDLVCSNIPEYLQEANRVSYWEEHKLQYPINLLRNIGRKTITTNFVFPLELGYWPVYGFANQFTALIKTFDLHAAHERVYCVTKYKLNTKDERFRALNDSRQRYIAAMNTLDMELDVDEDISKTTDHEMTKELLPKKIFRYGMDMYQAYFNKHECGKYFVSYNNRLPMLDERVYAGDVFENDLKFDMLEYMQFALMMLKGTGLVHVGDSSYKHVVANALPRNFTEQIEKYPNYALQWRKLFSRTSIEI